VILLTRLDNKKFLVNLDTIKFIESTPDTLISFVNGDNIIVRESLDDIEQRVLEYRIKALKGVSESSVS
jgi:flagellar protein FlbD